MSKPREIWWSYVKAMIRRYPSLRAAYSDAKMPIISAAYSDITRCRGTSRPTEVAALKELPATQQKEYESVHKAIEITKRGYDGSDRLKLIKMVFWDKTHTINGAAMEINIAESTAVRWHGDFIRLVAKYYGLID